MQLIIDSNPLDTWVKNTEMPLIISGPCSAENEEQVVNTALKIAATGKVNVLRAGVWKPRTRPGEFEGMGASALPWLQKAKVLTGLPIAVEVANASHVEQALKAGIDVLWIGARTTVNPFSVQEIADALRGVDIPIWVKNPVNPDLQLWLGALERVNRAGITKLAAIHRGFSPFQATIFRNEPMWEIAINLKALCPGLPIICDPSHICGNTELIPYIAQKALDLDMQGLMIECHIDPKIALTDAKQQLTPNQLHALINGLNVRNPDSNNPTYELHLEQLRSEIDMLDQEIIDKLGQRMNVSAKIGKYKRENDVTILQIARYETLKANYIKLSDKKNLSQEFAQKLLDIVHEESIRRQTEVMNENK